MGIRDYTRKTGFQSVVIGLSGGVDSAATAALAVRALGPERVTGELAQRGIRINCISPSPTQSDFMSKLTKEIPEEAITPFFPSNGRFAEPDEMGRALVMIGSDLACFVSGVNLPVDFGYCAEVAMGQRDNLMGIS